MIYRRYGRPWVIDRDSAGWSLLLAVQIRPLTATRTDKSAREIAPTTCQAGISNPIWPSILGFVASRGRIVASQSRIVTTHWRLFSRNHGRGACEATHTTGRQARTEPPLQRQRALVDPKCCAVSVTVTAPCGTKLRRAERSPPHCLPPKYGNQRRFQHSGCQNSGSLFSLSTRNTKCDLLWRMPGILYNFSRNRRS